MQVVCISDLHGHLPDPITLQGDLLLIGGDICPTNDHSVRYQHQWLDTVFRDWLTSIKMPVVGVAGNHDWFFYRCGIDLGLPWTYLQDSGTEVHGYKIWGSPWQPRFHNWAFNADEPELERAWGKIPEDTDILLLHGPPYGIGDRTPYGDKHVGSPSLLERIGVVEPKLVVFGHIHSDRGVYGIEKTVAINASFVDEQYRPYHQPHITITID